MGGLLEGKGVFIILLVILLLFGAKRLPDLSRSLGRSLRIFKSETDGLRGDSAAAHDHDAPVSPPALPAAPSVQAGARELIDPVTGEKVMAQPVDKTPPSA